MNDIRTGLTAAFRLARGHADGLLLLTRPPDQAMAFAARSFRAMPLALLGFLVLHTLDWIISGETKGIARAFAQDLLGFVIGWLAFALLSHSIAATTGRATLWPRFIAAWNWCNVVQYTLLLLATVPALLELPPWVLQASWLVAIFWSLWLEYFTIRLALKLPKGAAIGMVMLDFGLGIAVAGMIGGFN